jgi:hypothetical protein
VYFEKNIFSILFLFRKLKIHFEISNKIIGEDRFEGGREIFMFIKRGHGLRRVEKHCCRI